MDSALPLPGLETREAEERLARFGPNEIEAAEGSGWLRTLRGVAAEPMFVLLVAAAVVYLAIGDIGEGILLAAFAGVTVGLVVYQERRSEKALDALRALAAPHARVIRDGRVQRIAARDLVPGDLVVIGEGERVAADAVVRESTQLSVDESLLTGESVPVRKVAAAGALDTASALPGGEDLPFVFAGTLVVGGHGTAEVFATGSRTRTGAIGGSLASIAASPTPLQLHLKRLVAWLGFGAIALSGLLVVWYGLARGSWLQGLLSGIAAAMSMLPEEFPMALSVFLALGAWRLARVKVLARRPAVIEALGGATMLCVDKTGTLTENRMRLRRLVTPVADVDLGRDEPLPEEVHSLLEYAMLASRREGVEPMDRAILASGDAALARTEHLHPGWLLQEEYPLTQQLLAMSHAWEGEDGVRRVAAKGAPEAVIELCHLDPARAEAATRQAEALASQGFRVLGVARALAPAGEAPANQHGYAFEWLGLAAFQDPLRADVPDAVAQAHSAGIGVAMITGDHVQTALAIARQAGMVTTAGALTGEQLSALDDVQLRQALRTVRVFARIMPEQKLRLVQEFRNNGEVVAMTGDGVNDAPALKAAHIGIAMGVRGTDVAREAAAIVLLDEDFGHIVQGVRMGRRIFDNLRKVMTYITAIHVPIAGVTLLPVLAGLPPLMLPAHVVLTEMIIDPVCSLAFEGAPEERGIMQRPPRRSDDALVGWAMLRRGAVQGVLLLAACLATYWIALRSSSVDSARGQAIIALTVGNLGLVWLNASLGVGWRSVFGAGYTAFWAVAAGATAALVAGFTIPGLRRLLHFALPTSGELAFSLGMGAAGVLAAALLLGFLLRLEQFRSRPGS
ncbi:cation-translocating P-type ATPase [Ramlibacter ginsenosidimutans]|uniref:Cation-translocating P-type ATPase n=1 Tax=Ramlibacter ginsenosidimutans TaxID=502333 RepID=A0A934TPG6_9BURK|nr:cation-translocating P-type ATPase [Ramlibacter ginsenosidimutans]MBK6004948.1 cation-translocating P-type ATPase [Ramlibacter ginsenosidimutans]